MNVIKFTLLVILLSACGDEATGSSGSGGAGQGDGDQSLPPVAQSDPDILATFKPWERSCVLWLRSDCNKAQECGIPPASDCWQSDTVLRFACQEMAAEDGCKRPAPASFDSCATRTDEKTCQEYCGSQFCFNFCFYSCDG